MENVSIKRLDILKNEMILSYLSEINDPRDLETYELLVDKTFSGEFNDIFLSNYLDDVSKEERNRILEISNKYAKSLCLYCDLINSCEGITGDDYDLVTNLVLDNYDYVIRLAKNGGEDVLKFLKKFESSDLSEKGAIIALLRNSFCDDDTLENRLIELSKEDGNYKDFSDTQKIMLCEYPEGTLYRRDDNNKVEYIPSIELKQMITKLYLGDNEECNIKDIDSKSFSEIVGNIILDYYGASYIRQ
jgi:hypothetical protein